VRKYLGVLAAACNGKRSMIPFLQLDLGAVMAQRRIGQEALRFDTAAERQTSLDALLALVDWIPAERALSSLYKAPKGEKAWPPLAMFKALLLATWYDLSDIRLAEALSGRASFQRFCGFARDEATPEHTAFVRFRRHLAAVAYNVKRYLRLQCA
jgi:transposase, IS5 family